MKYNEEQDVYEASESEIDYLNQLDKVKNLTKEVERLTKKLHEEKAILILLTPPQPTA